MSQVEHIYTGVGLPEGKVTGDPGDIYISAAGSVHFKSQGSGSTGWVWASAIDVGAFFPGVPGNSAIVLRVPVTRAIVFPVGLAGSMGVLGTAATASTVFSIQKNGVEFGTLTFAIAGTVGVFASAAGATFAAGDILSIIAPASADATAADIGITLTGNKSA